MLDIDIWNFIWPVINIILLFILLRIFLFKPINKIMNDRTASVQNDIDSAKKSMEEAEAMKKQYAETLAGAQEEAQQIILRAREEAAASQKEILQNSQNEAQQIIDSASKTIENERKRVMQQAQTQIADLAIAAASKIIEENVDDEKNRQIVSKFLSEEGAIDNGGK